MNFIEIAFRNLFRNRRRSILSLMGVVVASLSITFLFSMLAGLSDDIEKNAWEYETGEVHVRNQLYNKYEYLYPVQYVVPNYTELTQFLRERQGIAAVSPRIQVPGISFIGEEQISAVGIGLDMESESEYQNLGDIVIDGRLPEPNSNEALIGAGLAQKLGVTIGDEATFMTQTRYRSSNAFTVDIVGIAAFPVTAMNSRTYVLPIERADYYMRMDGGASEILIKTTEHEPERTTAELNEFFSQHAAEGWNQLEARSWTKISAGYASLSMAGAIYSIMALIFFLLAATVIISTTMMIINERTREIGTLSALGMSEGQLVRLFFTEAALLGFAGAFIGVLLGIAITVPVGITGLDISAKMDMMDMGISSLLYPRINIMSTVGVFFFAWITSMAATYPSAQRAAKLKPVEALRAV